MTPELREALKIVARVHTRADANHGFVIMMGATPSDAGADHSAYVEAWRLIRKTLGQTTEPWIDRR